MYRRGETGQVARALRVWDELRGYKAGRWVSDVARTIGASDRTVRRDIDELRDAGVDIEITKQANRIYACVTGEQSSTVSIAKRERFTLLAIRRVFDVFKHTPLLEDIVTVLEKLEQRMTEKERAEHAAFGEQFVYMPDHGTKSYEGTEDVVDAIQDAIMKRRIIRYRYADARGRSRAGHLAPFRLAMYRHGLYVVGARLKAPDTDVAAAPLGVFAVERFAEAEVLKRHEFALPPDSSVIDVLSGAFGPHLPDADGPHNVVVEFNAEKAHLVASRSWHPTQVVTPLADGSVQIALRVPSLAPIVSWVLEWGPHARAIAPARLVDHIVAELDAARARYNKPEANSEP